MVKSDFRVLTPLGFGRLFDLNGGPRETHTIGLDDLVHGEVVTLDVTSEALRIPELRHFPDDDPVEQFELWSLTDRVVELATLHVTRQCQCACKSCFLVSTGAWVLGHQPTWAGTVHDFTNSCQCLIASVCDCLAHDPPDLDRERWIELLLAMPSQL